MYFLVRATPERRVREHAEPMSLRMCAIMAGYVLHDNANVTKEAAQEFSRQAETFWEIDDGTMASHASGYSFTLRKADS